MRDDTVRIVLYIAGEGVRAGGVAANRHLIVRSRTGIVVLKNHVRLHRE